LITGTLLVDRASRQVSRIAVALKHNSLLAMPFFTAPQYLLTSGLHLLPFRGAIPARRLIYLSTPSTGK